MPEQFWHLTVREFWIKHAAFQRSEDRTRSLMLEHVASTVPRRKKSDQAQLMRAVHALRRYPVKKWVVLPSP
jgi:hypothetical protein